MAHASYNLRDFKSYSPKVSINRRRIFYCSSSEKFSSRIKDHQLIFKWRSWFPRLFNIYSCLISSIEYFRLFYLILYNQWLRKSYNFYASFWVAQLDNARRSPKSWRIYIPKLKWGDRISHWFYLGNIQNFDKIDWIPASQLPLDQVHRSREEPKMKLCSKIFRRYEH